MVLKFITCSGANEYTNVSDLEYLFTIVPSVDDLSIGVQVSGKKGGKGTPRYDWLSALYKHAKHVWYKGRRLNIGLHVNGDWVESFSHGKVPSDLNHFLKLKVADEEPFIKSVQLNFKIGRDAEPKLNPMLHAMKKYPNQKFILSYNESNAGFIHDLRKAGGEFCCLYDQSFGEGILAQEYKHPVFENEIQGYAGGLSPENVCIELDKLNKLLSPDAEIFVDAEGRLKGKNGRFSIKRAENFIRECLVWREDLMLL